jgi:RimJ/RimL family protein N-acetyltransferase
MGIKQQIKKACPIYSDRCMIELLSKQTVFEYSMEIKKKYFYQYLDDTYILKASFGEIANALRKDIARLVILDRKTVIFIGGITLFDSGDNKIDMAYWITEAYQGRGIAKESIIRTIQLIKSNLKQMNKIYCEIQSINNKSLRLVNSCGFKYVKSIQGRIVKNDIYELNIGE